MLMNKKLTAIIPAKSNSVRLPGKNLTTCCGKPLVAYPVGLCKEAGFFDDILLSSDSAEIRDAAKQCCGFFEPYVRPAALSRENSNVWDAVRHALLYIEERTPAMVSDYVVLLHATSPCLRLRTLEDALTQFLSSWCDSLVSVSRIGPYHFKENEVIDFSQKTKSQDEPVYYQLNNAFFASDWETMKNGTLYETKIMTYAIPNDESVDINVAEDVMLAEAILEWRKTHDQSQ